MPRHLQLTLHELQCMGSAYCAKCQPAAKGSLKGTKVDHFNVEPEQMQAFMHAGAVVWYF